MNDLRKRLEVWTNAGFRDGYDATFRPPKAGNRDLLQAYLDGWGQGTDAAIRDRTEKKEKTQ